MSEAKHNSTSEPKTVLIYGDSNTWGYVAETKLRYNYHERWSTVLQECLGREEFLVIPEGLSGRYPHMGVHELSNPVNTSKYQRAK
eukprot:TRINITY_DN14242_c0_g1_i1.p1 TRINITY_DN14242_c0_g1~~TRINITY_DN14242_c0_g1_i1.p1  ORF type:complete len:86 (+),score=14.57 TRINITY_DN14242_c0_g1_i1:422-679(+)